MQPLISPNAFTIKSGDHNLAGRAIALAAAVGALLLFGTAYAQIPNPPATNEQPSQVNPFPRAGSDAQNTGRAHDDKLWGTTDANRRYFEVPFGRIPNFAAVAAGNGKLVKDGWQFPRLANHDVSRSALNFGVMDSTSSPFSGFAAVPTVTPGLSVIGSLWSLVAGPSTGFTEANYARTPAVPRPAAAIPTDPTQAPRSNQTVIYYPNVAGNANTIQRYVIQVFLPVPEPFPTDGSLPDEVRIDDARYSVYYQVPSGGGFVTHRRVINIAQTGSGWVTLTDSNNQPLFFPMVSNATATAVTDRPRVELDNSTEDDTTNAFVIADQIQFVPAQDFNEIQAPITVTPRHGGREVPRPTGYTLPLPYDPAHPLYQSDWRVNPSDNPTVVGDSLAFMNDSFSFINNPRQLDFAGTAEAAGNLDTVYTDKTSPFYQPFEPWNPSTLFQGPQAFVDDQTSATNPSGVVPVNRTNQNRFEDVNGNPIPFYSQTQAIIPMTEYVSDPNSQDGLGVIPVGCIYGVDWLTGTPLWRFPDRTYLPTNYVDQYKHAVIGAGLRNPPATDEAGNALTDINGNAYPMVPGIGAIDKNGDGVITDDEVYIVGQNGNGSGAVEAGVTIDPRLPVQGTMQVPLYNDAWNPYTTEVNATTSADSRSTPITGVTLAPPARYSVPTSPFAPVQAGVAFVASDNGVLYAIDPYGNNDNRYYNNAPGGVVDTTQFGTMHPGSTNLYWTFSTLAPARLSTDSNADYNLKLKNAVPATSSFGRSTPVIAYATEDINAAGVAINRATAEPRLFIGNANGNIYAIDPRSEVGTTAISAGPPAVLVLNAFPYRKEFHTQGSSIGGTPELRWWFETQGPINTAPAVSLAVHTGALGGNNKGVYVTSGDGRAYCVDWSGPINAIHAGHLTFVPYNGTNASALNDNFRFHNANSIAEFALPDGTEGTIRPRWVFPSRYRDLDGNGNNSELTPVKPPDVSVALGGGALCERQAALAPITAAPSVLDFPFNDPSTGLISIKRYVAVAANDSNGSDAPIRGKVYLLDEVGNRLDFSNNPVARTGTDGVTIAFGQPLDQYAPSDYTFTDAAPAWTYRSVYPRYTGNTAATATLIANSQNRPNQLYQAATGTPDDPTTTPPTNLGLPEKRTLPTVFAGGTSGRLFALDIDPQTGLFLRWRSNLALTKPYSTFLDTETNADVPADLATQFVLNPPSTVLGPLGLNARPALVRTVAIIGGAQDVESIVISGGPLQDRNHPFAATAALGGPTTPNLPTNSTPSWLGGTGNLFLGLIPPATAAVPVTQVRPPYWTQNNVRTTEPASPTYGAAQNLAGFALVNVAAFDFSGRQTNQDIDDPTSTTRGSYPLVQTPMIPGVPMAAIRPELNRAYQDPLLAVTTSDGITALISTELDGVDSSLVPQGTDSTALMGWGLTTDVALANPSTPFMEVLPYGGGPGTQVAMVTEDYYGAMDPGFRNTVAKPKVTPATTPPPGDASSTNFPYYPWYQPTDDVDPATNQPYSAEPVVSAPYGTPRARYEPRSLYAGNAANEKGPDGVATTGDGWPQVNADAHTGRTGLPLDLRGLFYDKAYADNRPQANRGTGLDLNNTNDDGLIRLPAYTGIGFALQDPTHRRLRMSLTGLTPNTYTALADGTPDTPRDSSTGATSPYRTDPFQLFPGALDTSNPADPTKTAITPEADIDPPGTNACWIFMGGTDGVFHAMTPNRYSVPGVGGNLSSGFDDTQPITNPPDNPALYGNAKVVLIKDAATYQALYDGAATDAGAVPPDPSGASSLIASGKRPYFEYGETIYAVVYDIGAPTGIYPTTISVQLQSDDNTVSITEPATVRPGHYTYAPAAGQAPLDPSVAASATSKMAMAFLAIQVNSNFSQRGGLGRRPLATIQGATQAAWTPGKSLQVTVPGFSGPGTSATEAGVLAVEPERLMIANPLAVQAFLASNIDGTLAQVADPSGTGTNVYNGIGPFAADDGSAAGSIKNSVADTQGALTSGDPTLLDPDRAAASYSQALSNGNTISRFDMDPYQRATPTTPITGTPVRNKNFNLRLRTTGGTDDPDFYMPIAASAGFINHGSQGSTNLNNSFKTLRLANRSLQPGLAKVRVAVQSDGLFRAWPGRRPNVDATDGTSTVAGVAVGGPAANGNPRLTPSNGSAYLMRPDGIENFLPWEQPVIASLPWERATVATGQIAASMANVSPDYPDIPMVADSSSSKHTLSVVTGSGDIVRSPGTLTMATGGQIGSGLTNVTISERSTVNTSYKTLQVWDDQQTSLAGIAGTAAVVVNVPYHQPANLVANHSLTSTYVAPSTDEAPSEGAAPGPFQLPRNGISPANLDARATADRGLRTLTGNQLVPTTSDPLTVTPMGYSVQLRVYVDANNNGQWDAGEPYRDFETWFGVPVDMTLTQGGSGEVDLPGPPATSGFAQGFGIQNGYLGYSVVQASTGFYPPDLTLPTTGTPNSPYYNQFFKPLTIQNQGNVNIWNLRASQKFSTVANGSSYSYFSLQSDIVDPRYGILATEADPLNTRLMPQVVTSLDKRFDTEWDTWVANDADFKYPINGVNGITRYTAYYRPLGGRHTIHKPLPDLNNNTSTVMSIPDLPVYSLPPTTGLVNGNTTLLPQPVLNPPSVGVAVPIGTPSGTYSNNISGTPLAFFEDHDTLNGYASRPLPSTNSATTLTLSPGGPLYDGQDYVHPGTIARNAGPQGLRSNVILPNAAESIFRPRFSVGNVTEYLPSTTVTSNGTRSAFNLLVTVKEGALTGGIADQALTGVMGQSIVTGVLPLIDNVPLFDVTNIASGQSARPASSVSPAAYRTLAGNLILLCSSNASTDQAGARVADARPGAPFHLFRSALTWNQADGYWDASNFGKPIDGTQTDTAANTGHWFSAPTDLTITGNPANASDVSPFVLFDPLLQSANTATPGATLLWMDVIPTVAGGAQYTPYYAALSAVGTTTNPLPLLPLGGANRSDPTLRRFEPRAVVIPGALTAFVFYYGGAPGRNTILYVPTKTNAAGAIIANGATGAAGITEAALRLPSAVTSASDPMPIVHWNGSQYVVDVYYTASVRGGTSSDICMSRYTISGTGAAATLVAANLPQQTETLSASGRSPVWHSQHMGWFNENDPNYGPLVSIQYAGETTPVVAGPQNWQVDNSSKLLYQSVQVHPGTASAGTVIVYLDASAGIVSFRGAQAPLPSNKPTVTATYVPLSYRVAASNAVESSVFGFMDRRPVNTGQTADNGNVLGAFTPGGITVNNANQRVTVNGVQTRYGNWASTDGQGIDRQWLMWQRSNDSGNSPTLYYTTRRVGVDLKALGVANGGMQPDQGAGLPGNEEFKLSTTVDANNNQAVDVSVTVGGAQIPFEVDPSSGKIYTQAVYEGQQAIVTGTVTTANPSPAERQITTLPVILGWIDEATDNPTVPNATGAFVPGSQSEAIGKLIPSVLKNEDQPYAFLDVFDGTNTARANVPSAANPFDVNPQAGGDPALQAGRVWMFWTSSRGRTGVYRVPDSATASLFQGLGIGDPITDSGYDLFWQTLAPGFIPPSASLY